MNSKSYYIITIVCFLFCCSTDKKSDQCECDDGIDYEFTSNYQNCITIISHYKLRSGIVDSDQFMRAVMCLYLVTDKYASIYQGDVVGYTSDEDYYTDLKAWNDWYSENYDRFSNKDAKIKFKEYSKENQMEIDWAPMFSDLLNESDK